MRVEMVNKRGFPDGETPGGVFSCPNLLGGSLSTRKEESPAGLFISSKGGDNHEPQYSCLETSQNHPPFFAFPDLFTKHPLLPNYSDPYRKQQTAVPPCPIQRTESHFLAPETLQATSSTPERLKSNFNAVVVKGGVGGTSTHGKDDRTQVVQVSRQDEPECRANQGCQTASPSYKAQKTHYKAFKRDEQGYGLLGRQPSDNTSEAVYSPALRLRRSKLLAVTALALLASPVSARNYNLEAKKLKALSCRRARVEVISKTLREIDRNLAKHFPHGPFVREDLIALALGESGFNNREINSQCVGELGIWQVRPEYFRAGNDGLQISINTAMAFRVLKNKQAVAKRIKSPFGIKKTTIICYNGWTRGRDGRINQRYYNWFLHNRRKVCKALYTPPSRPIRVARKPTDFIRNRELARQLEQDVYGGRS